MTDAYGAPGPYTQTPYKLVTTDIQSVGDGSYSGNAVYTNGSATANRGPDKLFDGDLNTSTYLAGPGEPGITLTVTFPGDGLPIQNKLEYYIAGSSIKNDGLVSVTANNGSSAEGRSVAWHEVPNPPANLTSLVFNNKAFGDSWNPGAIRIDGEIITEVVDAKLLTFADPNPDLQYFKPGDKLGNGSSMSVAIYTGNGGSQSITGLGFSPDLVWIKDRNTAYNHQLYDTIRGVDSAILPNETDGETDYSGFTSFDDDGFTVPNSNGTNSGDMVAWCWSAGDQDPAVNNDGTIEATVKAGNGLSIAKYTGNATQGATIGHGLGSVPKMVIVKRLDGSGAWEVYHAYEGPTRDYILNTNAAYTTRPDRWADTNPTSSVFSVGNSSSVNGSGRTYIAYCFADVPDSSRIDYYTGSISGNEIEVGFKPAFLLIKSRAADNWTIIDDKRPGKRLYANEHVAESDLDIELTDTGFKINSTLTSINGNGREYIYAAFADNGNPTVIDVNVANNTMVVDGGEWSSGVFPGADQSQTWSDAPNTNYGDLKEVFDGDLTTGAQTPTNTLGSIDASAWGFSDCLVEVYAAQQDPNITIEINGIECPATASGGNKEWTGVDVTGPLTSITCINTLGAHTLRAVRIDGVLLVDPGKAEHVEYQTNGGQGTIVSVNTDDNTLLIKDLDSNTRDNRWIAENKAGTDFYVAGPSVVDEPLLTADVELKSTDFATTPENADTLKNIVWELNGAEQNAGVSNPYKPTGLALNTEYTVRVKHQGNDLDDSEWSTATTFTTGATRNLYTYYKERVELLEARIAGIEADEIVDDATDVTLLTAFANLAQRVEALEEGGA